jgi:hypothetical protein
VHGTALGEYASQALKAGDAAQPKGCSACFVPRPQNQYRELNCPTKGAHIIFYEQPDIVQLFWPLLKTTGMQSHQLKIASLPDFTLSRSKNRSFCTIAETKKEKRNRFS